LTQVTLQRDRRKPTASEGRGTDSEPAGGVRQDLQNLLAGAVQRLRATTRCDSVVGWAVRDDGSPYVAAAVFSGPPPVPPDRDAITTVATLRGAADLGAPELPDPVRALEERYACRAAAPITTGDGRPLAALLMGGSSAALGGPTRGAVRPRTLAALDGAAQRLSGPLTAAFAARRLSQLDEEVRRIDRLAALGALSAEIAHEVRNPLVSVKTFLQLLPERRDDPEFLTSFFDVVTDEVERMERLLDTVLAHARPQAAASNPAPDSARVIATVVDLLRHRAQARGVAVASETEAGLPTVAVSEDRLRQVLLNLTMNAIDATPEDGTVRLRAHAAGDGVELVVSDEGPGIPEDSRTRVFEPFFSGRSDRPGGLGLAICRRIAEEAGGTIRVVDGRSGGAEFRVNLPTV
jgi:signal transduction histidine kinase